MYCSSCGKKISSKSNFCKHCDEPHKKKNLNKSQKAEYIWTCDYCESEFSTKKKSDNHELVCLLNPTNQKFYLATNQRKSSFFYWVTSLIVFGISIVIATNFSVDGVAIYSRFSSALFLGNILFGVIVFLDMLLANAKPEKSKNISPIIKYSVFISLGYIFLSSVIFASAGYSAKEQKQKAEYLKYQTPTTTPTQTPAPTTKTKVSSPKSSQASANSTNSNNNGKIDCIGPDGVQFKTTYEECKKLNESWGKSTDYIIDCKINANCGGGTRKLKISECNNSTCCQIGGSWHFYTSKQKCDQDQKNYYSNNYKVPTFAPLPTFKPLPTYSVPTYAPYASPTMTESQAQAIIDQYNREVQQCRSNVVSKYTGLIQSCQQYAGSAYEACVSINERDRQREYDACGTTY